MSRYPRGYTLPANQSVATTTADKITSAGVIVPAILYLNVQYSPLATITEYDLVIWKRAVTVVSLDVVPSTLQGGALTGTIVKASGTDTPVKTTTPLHTADAINFNTGAYTVQSLTLTATAADLTFSAGNRLGLDLSAAMTAGKGVITVGFKYV